MKKRGKKPVYQSMQKLFKPCIKSEKTKEYCQ